MRGKNRCFWRKNAALEAGQREVTLDFGLKTQVECLEKCFKVGKFTKICMKVTKSGGPAR